MEDFKKIVKMKTGGSVSKAVAAYEKRERKSEAAEDIKQDKAIVKKAFAMHDKQEHHGEKTDLSKLRKGGRAKKDCGTVKKYKTGGQVENQYAAKKTDKDIKDIANAKRQKPQMLCGGKSVSKYAEGKMVKQAGATQAQQKFYQENMEEADRKAAKKDYEIFGSRGDAARKGMEEGKVNPMGDVYNKGGKVAKKCQAVPKKVPLRKCKPVV